MTAHTHGLGTDYPICLATSSTRTAVSSASFRMIVAMNRVGSLCRYCRWDGSSFGPASLICTNGILAPWLNTVSWTGCVSPNWFGAQPDAVSPDRTCPPRQDLLSRSAPTDNLSPFTRHAAAPNAIGMHREHNGAHWQSRPERVRRIRRCRLRDNSRFSTDS